MATLQDIPSGEALATSRPKINSNFAALNTELGQKETPTGAQAKADAAQAAAISAAAAAQATADSKQAALANAGTLAKVSESAGLPLWDGAAWPGGGSGGTGTVTSVSVVSANGISGSVANASTTPAITLSIGAIAPTSVAATGAVTGSNLSGTNTGDQTSVAGNAGTATALQTARTINGVSFDGTANITVPAAAGTLTGSTLASGVTASSLTSAAGGTFGTAAFTDAGTAGKAVLTAETQAQVRAAAGFGGTVTVAQLNAAGADARSAMYYCSDCLTVNGPGSLVAWCGRTQTWRTLDDCLLATTDFAGWANDFILNSNAGEIRGIKGGLWAALEIGISVTVAEAVGAGSVAEVRWNPIISGLSRALVTGSSSATAYARQYSTSYQRSATGIKMFAGIRAGYLTSIDSGFTVRLGFSQSPTDILQGEEDSLCYDVGNVLGALNPSNLQKWLVCIRTGSVNQSGSGPTGVSPVVNTPANLLVVRQSAAVTMYHNGVLLGGGTGGSSSQILNPFCVIANDGTATTSVAIRQLAFCTGFLLP